MYFRILLLIRAIYNTFNALKVLFSLFQVNNYMIMVFHVCIYIM